jgi:hypothetical protein
MSIDEKPLTSRAYSNVLASAKKRKLTPLDLCVFGREDGYGRFLVRGFCRLGLIWLNS